VAERSRVGGALVDEGGASVRMRATAALIKAFALNQSLRFMNVYTYERAI
jgi:hypothetical protein